MPIIKKPDGYWVPLEGEYWGPWPTKKEAQEALRDMTRSAKARAKGPKEFAKFVTTDKDAQREAVKKAAATKAYSNRQASVSPWPDGATIQ